MKRLRRALDATRVITGARHLTVRTRCQLLLVQWRVLLKLPGKRARSISVPGGSVYIAAETMAIDLAVFVEIWIDRIFPTDCNGRLVIDVGAHKGYFGARALADGALAVVSCEPQSQNFSLLERARRANHRHDCWTIERVAIGSAEGSAQLYVSAESWAHSIHRSMVDSTASEEVAMTTLAAVLRRATADSPDADVVLKVNVEGAAADVLMPATSEDLEHVLEIHLDHEPGSPYSLDDLLGHLASVGLDHVTRSAERLFVITRSVDV
ncbi:MAG: FkbM family methyltransferase [Acidimicrobiia bacterium]